MSKQSGAGWGNVDPRQIQGPMRQGESNIVLMYEAVSPLTGPFDSPLVGPFRSPLIGEFLVGGPSGGAAPLNVGAFTDGDLLIGSSSTGRVVRAKLTAGTGITITNTAGGITITGGSGGGVLYGTHDAIPSAATAGDRALYRTTNSPYEYVSNGSSWQAFAYGQPVTEPVDSSYSWRNQGGASVNSSNGGVMLTVPSSGTDNIRIREINVPTAPYTITASFILHHKFQNFAAGGICLVESGSGKLVTFGSAYDTGVGGSFLALQVTKWNSVTSFNSHYSNLYWHPRFSPYYLRITDNNTNRISYYSLDGINWIQFHSISRTDFITPNKLGFYGNTVNNEVVYLDVIHWLVT